MAEHQEHDAAMMARVARGDRDAVEQLYDRHLSLLIGWSMQQTGDRELAADLTAEVFAAALIASPRYRAEQGTVAAWLLGIARNKLLESWRRRRIEDQARRRLGIGPLQMADEDLERVDELASVDPNVTALLEALPAEQREAVTQRVLEERSYEEIAAQLDCSKSVVRQRVSRGLRTLKSELEGR